MRFSLADYQLLGPSGPGGERDGVWLARPPARLSDLAPTVVVNEIDDPGPVRWRSVVEQLSALTNVKSDQIPALIEAGREDDEVDPVAWVARLGADAQPVMPGGDRSRALRAVAGAARGAHALHEAGFAHGAIGPSSVLIAGDRGLLEPPIRSVLTTGPVATPSLTAAELDCVDPGALWGEGPSRAGDIWSLAATTHSLVTGQLIHPALVSDPIVTAVQRILIELPQLNADLDARLEELLRWCLDPDPAARPATAADLADRLDELVAG